MKLPAFAALLAAALLLAACSDGESAGSGSGDFSYAAEAGHVHGLGVNPADDALFVATHGGLFRAPVGSTAPVPVGESRQDTMGFTVAGPDRFLGSGHPAPGEGGPPSLGLIESRDAGRNWREVSLGGQVDFHVLRYAGDKVYGFDGSRGALMTSGDGGASWQVSAVPSPLYDLAVDPGDPAHLVGASEAGLIERTGGSWRPRSEMAGLLTWPEGGPLYIVEGDGTVSASEDSGRTWERRGSLAEAPAAVASAASGEVYVALQSGTVMRSDDGGRSWTPRVRP